MKNTNTNTNFIQPPKKTGGFFNVKLSVKIITQFFIVCILSCKSNSQQAQKQATRIVVFQPLDFFQLKQLSTIKRNIEVLYNVKIVIAQPTSFPASCYYEPRNRFRADLSIRWLQSIMPDSAYSIVGITTQDISTTKGNVYDYGVMGLGYKPGKSCIVSTYRLIGKSILDNQLQERLFKLIAHEMGHNFGLDHCSNQQCIMVDAEGKMKLDQEKDFCSKCKEHLYGRNFILYL